MDDGANTDKVFTVDFRFIERKFKAMEAKGESISEMRDGLNDDVQRAVADLNDLIDAKVKTKHQGKLRQHISDLIELWISLGIAEFKLAARDVKQEDASEGKRLKYEQERAVSLAVAEANPELTVKALKGLVDEARSKMEPPLKPIGLSTLYEHVNGGKQRNST